MSSSPSPPSSSPPQILRTTVGDLPLEEYLLRLEDDGGRSWRVLHTGAILSHEDERRFLSGDLKLPYGIVLWPAAIALAHEIATRPPDTFKGKRVLELGAGTGLPGIVAASLGAAQVVQTERQTVALFVCKKNAELNEIPLTTMQHRAADWTEWNDDALYDFILASDVLYAETMHPHLLRIFESNLAPGGHILLSDPFRKASFPLIESMTENGWVVAINKWTVGVNPPARPVGVFDLSKAPSPL